MMACALHVMLPHVPYGGKAGVFRLRAPEQL